MLASTKYWDVESQDFRQLNIPNIAQIAILNSNLDDMLVIPVLLGCLFLVVRALVQYRMKEPVSLPMCHADKHQIRSLEKSKGTNMNIQSPVLIYFTVEWNKYFHWSKHWIFRSYPVACTLRLLLQLCSDTCMKWFQLLTTKNVLMKQYGTRTLTDYIALYTHRLQL